MQSFAGTPPHRQDFDLFVGQTGYAPVPSGLQPDASTKLASPPNARLQGVAPCPQDLESSGHAGNRRIKNCML